MDNYLPLLALLIFGCYFYFKIFKKKKKPYFQAGIYGFGIFFGFLILKALIPLAMAIIFTAVSVYLLFYLTKKFFS